MELTAFENGFFIREASNQDCEQIKAIVFGVLREFGLEPDPNETDADLNDIEKNYFKRGGLFEVIVDLENNVLGTVGVFPVELHICELRKMYFAPQLRGKGLGKKLMERTVKQAKYLGFTRMTLETASVLKAAISLYESFGFQPYKPEHHAPRSNQSYYLEF